MFVLLQRLSRHKSFDLLRLLRQKADVVVYLVVRLDRPALVVLLYGFQARLQAGILSLQLLHLLVHLLVLPLQVLPSMGAVYVNDVLGGLQQLASRLLAFVQLRLH